jgi:hypothetical protein
MLGQFIANQTSAMSESHEIAVFPLLVGWRDSKRAKARCDRVDPGYHG